MKQRYFLLTIACILVSVSISRSQKVKYKDLYVLLSSGDFDQAEPFLRSFLSGEADHPNANLFMARFYQHRMSEKDILKENELYVSCADSAVIFYRNAFNLIDEKEVKKNDDYYQDYSRRDLRTGKFGIKLADIQFDLEGQIEKVEKVKIAAVELQKRFSQAITSYAAAREGFNELNKKFGSREFFLLQSTDDDIASLRAIANHYNTFLENFNAYKNSLGTVPGVGYDQQIKVETLGEFIMLPEADFYLDNVYVYDLATYCDLSRELITKEIMPLTSGLKAFDEELEKILTSARDGSAVVTDQLAALDAKLSYDQLETYDSDPLPARIFDLKIDEAEYYSARNEYAALGFQDSADVDLQVSMLVELDHLYKDVDNSFHAVREVNLENDALLYNTFISDRYGGLDGLRSYVFNKETEVADHKLQLAQELINWEERALYAVSDTDSIGLIPPDLLMIVEGSRPEGYVTMVLDTIGHSYAVGGLQFGVKDVQSYFALVGKDRAINSLVLTAIPGIKLDSVRSVHGWIQSMSVEEGEASENPMDTFQWLVAFQFDYGSSIHYMLAMYSPTSGEMWKSVVPGNGRLESLSINMDVGLIVLKLESDSPDITLEPIVFNLNGEALSSSGE